MKNQIRTRISFNDSELLNYTYTNKKMIVINIQNYAARIIELHFMNPIFFSDEGSRDFHELWQDSSMTTQLSDALLHKYGNDIPEDYSYQLFQVLDINYEPAIEIIAAELQIIYKEKNGDPIVFNH